MKRVLITGENSYIGNMFMEWIKQWPSLYIVDNISVRGEEWKQVDFGNYDTVLHVAGIVHTKETKNNINLFFKVNRDLTIEIAKKAKNESVNQFVFMSTMNVFGVDSGAITKKTRCNPKTAYGKSKLEAEKELKQLDNGHFKVAIIRPPMVYGPGAVGNYSRLSKWSTVTPVFPDITNKRSMIYIDNLSEFLRLVINNLDNGVFYPQNNQLVQTSEMVRLISTYNNHRIWFTKLGNPILHIFRRITLVKKIFGDLYYVSSLSKYKNNAYQIVNLEDSIERTESS